ncbi:MAG: lamin tail domain-containing protein [Bacteroidota bacterium]
MRKTLLFLLLLSVKLTFGQFRDNFSDGNFTIHPVWGGQTSLFTVNTFKQLKTSLSAVTQTINLSTSNALALNVKWEFSVHLNFDPSTTNLARIYLVADQADLRGNLNGYFVQIGESGGADSYDLYKQTGNSVSKIIDGLPKNRANVNFLSTKLRVTRDTFGKWQLYSSLDEGVTYVLEGSITDKTFTHTSWFGVYCKYTATRSDGFMFDDFNVEELVTDTTPPHLVSIKVVDDYTLEATFSETAMHSSALLTNAYKVKELNASPISVSSTALPNIFRLSFTHLFESARYTLVASGISDLNGNSTANSEISTFYIQPYVALKGNLVINEIFADPSPPVGLPGAEFVELWNTTDKYILLKDWKYKDLTSAYTFLADTLAPNSYVILCAMADESLFKMYSKTIGLSVWPTLNNDKDRLSIISAENVVIDEVSYGDNWFKDGVKAQGGFSLELIDPNNKCAGIQNWQASNHSNGGTPGFENSVYRLQLSSTAPKILSATIVDETTIKVDFSKSIDSLSGALIVNYNLNNGMGMPLAALPQSPDFMSVLLKLRMPITKGQEFVLTVNYVKDCAGNLIDANSNTIKLFVAKTIAKNDILISEILINPKLGGVDFIEIYNTTGHVLDLATLKLGSADASGKMANLKTITSNTTYIPSKTFWLLTSEIENVKQHYEVKNPAQFTKMASLPAYMNEKGAVILVTDSLVIDRFDYYENMHFPLIKMIKGVSLERVSFQLATNEKGNFKSAAQASGFATPTYKNSQDEGTNTTNNVWLSANVFSPDGDGNEDVLKVNYRFVDQDYIANAMIYNDKGVPVKKIFRNTTIPKEGYFVWDGLNDAGGVNKVGIYIIKFEIFALNGKSRQYEKACVLAAKLN